MDIFWNYTMCKQMVSYCNTVSSFVILQKPERQTSIEEKRKYVVAELLETEKSYVEALKMIQEVTTVVRVFQ